MGWEAICIGGDRPAACAPRGESQARAAAAVRGTPSPRTAASHQRRKKQAILSALAQAQPATINWAFLDTLVLWLAPHGGLGESAAMATEKILPFLQAAG